MLSDSFLGGPPEHHRLSDSVDVRISLRWEEAGSVVLDRDGKLAFGRVEAAPGLYRISLRGNLTPVVSGVYVGETDNLRRRLAGNYRNPGPSQQTSKRINALLLRHLAEDGAVELATSLAATIWIAGTATALDLTSKAGRLLAESAALVQLRVEGRVEIQPRVGHSCSVEGRWLRLCGTRKGVGLRRFVESGCSHLPNEVGR